MKRLVEGGYDSVWTISETDSKYHSLKQLVFENDKLDYYDERGAQIIARQQLTSVYHRNGAAYAITRECLLEQKTKKGKKTCAVIIEGPMISMDTLFDFELVEWIMKRDSISSRVL